jgi:hypothetical protein
MVKLLRNFQGVHSIRLKFSWRKYLRGINADPADEMAAAADFSPCRSMDASHKDDDHAECCDGLEDIHGKLCYDCRMGCLRWVVVEFDAEELTCFQVQLVKFLAKRVRGRWREGIRLEPHRPEGGEMAQTTETTITVAVTSATASTLATARVPSAGGPVLFFF